MRKITVFLMIALMTIVSPTAVFAQRKKNKTLPKPPPQAAFFASGERDAEGWTRYVSIEGGFNVLFPGKPERSVKAIESGFGNQQLVTYTASAERVAYVVGFLDFKTPVNDEASLRTIYDNWQKGVVSVYPNGELDARDTVYENKPARELVYVADLTTIRAKAFFSKGKLFQMMTMSFVEGDDALLREVSATNDKFFESLKLDAAPVVEKQNNTLAGEVRDRFYRNNYFNFSLTLPEDWLIIGREDTNLLREGTKERSSQKGKSDVATSLNRTTFIFNLARTEIGATDNGSIIGAVEVSPAVKATLPQLATAIALNFVRSGYTLDGAIEYPKVDGVAFAVIDLKKNGVYGTPVRQRLYVTRSKGYLIEFVATYTKDEDLAVFEEMIKTVKFARRK